MEEKIFITLGSQKFQFNRLLIAVDKLCEKKIICGEDVFAQIGYSDYVPKNYRYNNFLDREEFSMEMGKADIVITHGGTGAIIGAVKKEKKVIAVPRLAKYGEHVDDHQLQLIKQFDDLNLICPCRDALLRCTGEILCIADDDMVYTDTYREDIINEFQKHPEADALVFNVTALNDERSGKPIEKYARVGKRESREYGSVHIAIRKRALIGKNVYFNTLFGSGATYSCGEDTLFLKELIEKDLKLYKTPIRIASVDMSDSTWFKGYNEKYFKDKGALIEAAYPRCSYLLAILQSVRNSKKSLGSYKKAAKLFSYYTSGIADYRKVISGGDATEGENIRK